LREPVNGKDNFFKEETTIRRRSFLKLEENSETLVYCCKLTQFIRLWVT